MLTRVATAVLAGSIALAAILWREPWGFVALGLAILIFGTFEAAKLRGSGFVEAAIVPCVFGPWLFLSSPSISELLAGGLLLWTIGLLVSLPERYNPSFWIFFWILLGVGCGAFLQLQSSPSSNAVAPNLLLLALLPLWVGDSLAYFVGKAIGKHRMAPGISPNKTWEGAVANLLGCLGAAYGIGAWLGVPVVASLAVGLTTGVLGQVGDLLQSRLKRLANVKDSGSVLPGHGGILDRLDSFLFSSYPSLLALYLLAPEAFHVKQWPW